MHQIIVRLRPFAAPEMAAGVIDDILEAGEIRYTDQHGETQTVFVAHASIEEDPKVAGAVR
jgi:hypothetical protein